MVVFLPGAMVAGWMWTQQVEELSAYRCVVPDLPGFGASGTEEWLSLSDTADQVAALIRDECDDGSANVVGLSLGGLVGLHIVARHPDAVRSLLVSGVPFGSLSVPLRIANRLLLWLYCRWGAAVVARVFGMPDEESRRAFLDSAARTDPTALRRIYAELDGQAIPDLAAVHVAALAVVGSKDSKPARRFVEELPGVLPHGTGRVVEGVGHQWNAEQPELFSELVQAWITGKPRPPGLHAPNEPA